MPKPILYPKQYENQSQQNNIIRDNRSDTNSFYSQPNGLRVERLLRKARSKEYMEALAKLDSIGHVQNQEILNEIIEQIREEFPEISLDGILLGFVAKCYLEGHEVHVLDFGGRIVKHYKRGELLPNGLEKARILALSGSYSYVEVYDDCCRAISPSGFVSVIKV